MSRQQSISSLTQVSTYVGKHVWAIKNWRGWVDCSGERQVAMYSDIFTVPIIDLDGLLTHTRWMIKAFPTRLHHSQTPALALRLVSLDDHRQCGTFQFATAKSSFFGGLSVMSTFKPLPLDTSHRWSTCVTKHPDDDLFIKIKIKIAVPSNVPLAAAATRVDGRYARVPRLLGLLLGVGQVNDLW